MPSHPLFTVVGLVGARHAVTLDETLAHAVVDRDGRLLVSMIDVLADAHLAVDADLLVVEFATGASSAVRMAEIVDGDGLQLYLRADRSTASGEVAWSALLWSEQTGSSPVVASISATTFAAFVGTS